MRQSNHTKTEFTDKEVMTTYLFGIHKNRSKVEHIHPFAKEHLSDWFPIVTELSSL